MVYRSFNCSVFILIGHWGATLTQTFSSESPSSSPVGRRGRHGPASVRRAAVQLWPADDSRSPFLTFFESHIHRSPFSRLASPARLESASPASASISSAARSSGRIDSCAPSARPELPTSRAQSPPGPPRSVILALGIEFLSKIIQTGSRRIQGSCAGQEMLRSVTRGDNARAEAPPRTPSAGSSA
jgi:hypothetical protein